MLLSIGPNTAINLDDVATLSRRIYTENGQKVGEVIEVACLSRPGRVDHVRDPDGSYWQEVVSACPHSGLIQINGRLVVAVKAISILRVVPVEDTGGEKLEIRLRNYPSRPIYQDPEEGVVFRDIIKAASTPPSI